MRVYFLLEDSRSFFETLPCWLSILKPTYRRVPEINRIYNGDCYVMKSGCGFPRILGVDPHSPAQNVLGATITDINRYGNIDRLVRGKENRLDFGKITEISKKVMEKVRKKN